MCHRGLPKSLTAEPIHAPVLHRVHSALVATKASLPPSPEQEPGTGLTRWSRPSGLSHGGRRFPLPGAGCPDSPGLRSISRGDSARLQVLPLLSGRRLQSDAAPSRVFQNGSRAPDGPQGCIRRCGKGSFYIPLRSPSCGLTAVLREAPGMSAGRRLGERGMRPRERACEGLLEIPVAGGTVRPGMLRALPGHRAGVSSHSQSP